MQLIDGIYSFTSERKVLPLREELTCDHLLLPLQLVNRLCWSRGYFETLANIPLAPADVLERHCFLDPDPIYGRDQIVDENGNAISCPDGGLIGFFALGNYRMIDDELSGAVGLPLAPD